MRTTLPTFLCAALAAMLLPLAARATPVISEVLWMGSDLSTTDEWLEISVGDTSPEGLVLDGWTITSVNGSGQEVTIARFGTGSLVQSGSCLVVSRNAAEHSRLQEAPFLVSPSLSLPNTKLLLRLYDASGALIDIVDDGVGAPMAGANPSGGVKASMERIARDISGTDAANWRTASSAFGFDPNTIVMGTPGFCTLEVTPMDEEPPAEATGGRAWYTEGSGALILHIHWIPSVSEDLAAQMLVLSAPGVAPIGYSFDSSLNDAEILASDSGDVTGISLVSIDATGNHSQGVIIAIEPYIKPNTEEYSSSSKEASSFSSEAPSSTASSSSWSAYSSLSSSSQGTSSALPDIRITEVLPNPFGVDNEEWVELFNASSDTVHLSGWTIKRTSQAVVIATGAYLVPGQYLVLRKPQTGLSLPNESGEVSLWKGTSLISRLTYPSFPEGVSAVGQVGSDTAVPSCEPTPGSNTRASSWSAELTLQSGSASGIGHTSVNVIVETAESTVPPLTCRILFGDGTASDSCNPGSHAYQNPGEYVLRAEAKNYCGTTIVQTLHIAVQAEEDSDQSGDAEGESNTEYKMYSASQTSSKRSSSSSRPSCSVGSPADVVVSEALPDPAGSDSGEWIELQNRSDATANLCGWSLSDASGKAFSLDGLSISPENFLVLPYTQTKLSLGNDGDSVRLSFQSSVVDGVDYVKSKSGQSFARQANDSFAWMSDPTPGYRNGVLAESNEGVVVKASASKSSKPKTPAAKKATTAKPKTTAKKANVPTLSLQTKTLPSLSADERQGSISFLKDRLPIVAAVVSLLCALGIVGWYCWKKGIFVRN